jgi:SET domain-containing protein
MGVRKRPRRTAAPIAIGVSARHGRGVFATRRIRAGALIDEAPVMVIPPEEIADLKKLGLRHYVFLWGEDERAAAVLFGPCSLCNHSYEPNASFDRRFDAGTVAFVALRGIAAGEEITINYHGDPSNRDPLWFAVRP